MARIVPDDWKNLAATGAAARERETLALLEEALPDDYTVYHGVHWTRLNQGFSVFGEADFVIVSPSGRVMIVEQKTGFLRETPKGLVKVYLQTERNVAIALARTIEGMHRRFTAAFGAGTYFIEELLYCPDHIVKDAAIAGVNPARIVDATRKERLAAIIREALPADEPRLACAAEDPPFSRRRTRADARRQRAGRSGGHARHAAGGRSGDLGAAARILAVSPARDRHGGLRQDATGGAGHEGCGRARRSGLCTCVSTGRWRTISRGSRRPRRKSRTITSCATGLRATAAARRISRPPTFSTSSKQSFADTPIDARWQFDVLDRRRRPGLPAAVGRRARTSAAAGRGVVVAGRPAAESLYARAGRSARLDDAEGDHQLSQPARHSRLSCATWWAPSVPLAAALASGSPFDGSDISLSTYDEAHAAEGCIDATKRAITQALSLGFRKQDIAVLSFRGREGSAMSSLDQLGPHRLRSFTGKYDLFGNPEYREGDVLLESIYRFKGQSAPCVILTEVDFDSFDERSARKLFVGATRATHEADRGGFAAGGAPSAGGGRQGVSGG